MDFRFLKLQIPGSALINLVLAFLINLLLFPDVHAAPAHFDIDLDQEKLARGKIQIITQKLHVEGKGKKKRVVGAVIIDAEVSKVWKVLEDWDAMGNYVSSLEYYKTVKTFKPSKNVGALAENDDVWESLIEGCLKVAFVTIRYTLKVTFDKKNMRQDWRLVTDQEADDYHKKKIAVKKSSASLKNIEGFEYIEPYGNGDQTLYVYAPIVEVSGPVPGWIERKIAKTSLKEYIRAVKNKAQSEN